MLMTYSSRTRKVSMFGWEYQCDFQYKSMVRIQQYVLKSQNIKNKMVKRMNTLSFTTNTSLDTGKCNPSLVYQLNPVSNIKSQMKRILESAGTPLLFRHTHHCFCFWEQWQIFLAHLHAWANIQQTAAWTQKSPGSRWSSDVEMSH